MEIRTDTLFSKLIIRFILIIIISIALLGILMIYNFNSYLYQQKEDEIVANTRKISSFILKSLIEKNIFVVRSLLEVLARINNGQVWLINSQGIIIMSYPTGIDNGPVKHFKYKEVLSGKIVSQRINQEYFKEPMLLIGFPLGSPDNKIVYGLLVFTPVSGIRKVVNQVIRLMFFSSLLAVLLSIFVAYNWSRSLSNPLKNISGFALKLSSGKFGQTINLQEKRKIKEIQDLGESINQMSLTLQKTIDDLTEEKNKLKYVLTGMEEGVLAVNKGKEIILINNSARRLFISKKGDVTGEELNEVVDNSKIVKMFTNVLTTKEIYSEELSLKKRGSLSRLLIHLTPIKINKELWGAVALFQDITERWRFEQLQREFVTNVSHDLKTPLSSIKGATEILLDEIVDTPQKRKEYLEMINEESNRLERLVKEILTIEEVNNTDQLLKKEIINVKKLLEDVSMIFKSIADSDSKSVEIIKLFPSKSIYVRANREKLKQVLLNLLDNAYKFSTDGGIVEMGFNTAGSRVKVWIKDNGIGIPPGELENIWERFYKVDKARDISPGEGSGLGLSIVKQIIEVQGGSVFVESKLEQGSTFGFYLDQAQLN